MRPVAAATEPSININPSAWLSVLPTKHSGFDLIGQPCVAGFDCLFVNKVTQCFDRQRWWVAECRQFTHLVGEFRPSVVKLCVAQLHQLLEHSTLTWVQLGVGLQFVEGFYSCPDP